MRASKLTEMISQDQSGGVVAGKEWDATGAKR